MASRNRHKSKYSAVPEKPEMGITNYPSSDELDETRAPGLETFGMKEKYERGTGVATDELGISAPVNIPDRDSLAVDLVKADLVFRLEEYRSDEARFAALFYTFLGALLGFITTFSMSDTFKLTMPIVVVGVLLVIISVIFFVMMRLYKVRADEKIGEIKKQQKIK